MEQLPLQHWREYQNPDYLGVYSLLKDTGKIEMTLTVIGFDHREVMNEGKKSMCRVLLFDNSKPMCVNVTNAERLELFTGEYIPQKWVGVTLTLHLENNRDKRQKKFVDRLRIKEQFPEQRLLQNYNPGYYDSSINMYHLCPGSLHWYYWRQQVQRGVITVDQLRQSYYIHQDNANKLLTKNY